MASQPTENAPSQTQSSRIFVRGLPPTITDSEFKSHFSKRAAVTDVKLFPSRRIGYVGFRKPENAQDAINYFNKSYIRTSRIHVEAAVQPGGQGRKNNRDESNNEQNAHNPLKRKRQELRTTKHDNETKKQKEHDPKLKEYLGLMMHPSRAQMLGQQAAIDTFQKDEKKDSKKPSKKTKPHEPETLDGQREPIRNLHQDTATLIPESREEHGEISNETAQNNMPQDSNATDADWIRSRTSRLLGLVDEEETERRPVDAPKGDITSNEFSDSLQQPTPPPEDAEDEGDSEVVKQRNNQEADKASIQDTGRLFLRNLSYEVNETDLEENFAPFGKLEEVHLATDSKTGSSKGLAFIQFHNAEDAVAAYDDLDGTVFQGRLLHVLPAEKKRESKLDEFSISQMPLKKQKQVQKRAQAMNSTFNWNSLYMNTDAVMSSISDRLGVAKSELFDPSSSDAAVKQAQAETHVIQETKSYFETNGVDLNGFKVRERDDCAILVKNFTYGVRAEELKKLFAEFGEVSKVLMPPSGTIAIVQFAAKTHAQAAFKGLAYRKHKDSVLFLEKAPKGILDESGNTEERQQNAAQGRSAEKPSTSEIMQLNRDLDSVDTSTLFIRNLNFSTSNERLLELFRPLDGLRSVRVKTKPDHKNKGQTLSMGFGFAEFDSKEHALSALIAMNGYSLDGHELVIKASHKGADLADERRREDRAKRVRERKSKIIIKNLPFEATNRDVRNLFRTYGQLRAVRLPKKFDNSRKGYAFAEFTTPKDAESAMAALQSTHLLGRRLVLDYAAGEPDDPEEELRMMQQKISKQSSKVALQNLTSSQRRKFETGNNGVDEEGAA